MILHDVNNNAIDKLIQKQQRRTVYRRCLTIACWQLIRERCQLINLQTGNNTVSQQVLKTKRFGKFNWPAAGAQESYCLKKNTMHFQGCSVWGRIAALRDVVLEVVSMLAASKCAQSHSFARSNAYLLCCLRPRGNVSAFYDIMNTSSRHPCKTTLVTGLLQSHLHNCHSYSQNYLHIQTRLTCTSHFTVIYHP